jgi:hypothetical protein
VAKLVADLAGKESSSWSRMENRRSGKWTPRYSLGRCGTRRDTGQGPLANRRLQPLGHLSHNNLRDAHGAAGISSGITRGAPNRQARNLAASASTGKRAVAVG